MKNIGNWKHRHYGEHVILTVMVLALGSSWIPLPHWAHRIAGVLVAVSMGVAIGMTYVHRRGELCEDCVRGAPLDPQKAVQRRKPVLRVFHVFSDTPLRETLFLAVILAFDMAANLFTPYSMGNVILIDIPLTLLVVRYFSVIVHRSLQPWCPWCRWGDGGTHEHTLTPIVPEKA